MFVQLGGLHVVIVVHWMLYFNVFEHFGAEANLVGPVNAAALRGEGVVFNCSSTKPDSKLLWSMKRIGGNGEETLTREKKIRPQFENEYYVLSGNSRFDLGINRTETGNAGRYICLELSSSNSSSAELTVLESQPTCNVTVVESSVSVRCDSFYNGNLKPEIEIRPETHQVLDSEGGHLTVSLSLNLSSFISFCSVGFSHNSVAKAGLTPETINGVRGMIALNPPTLLSSTQCVVTTPPPKSNTGMLHVKNLLPAIILILFIIS